MDLSSTKDFWIHPNALTITLNYFGDQQLIQTSMLAGAVIMAYNKDYIGYNAAHDFREWKLQAYPTQLSDTCEYFVHAVLSRDGDSAMIVYSPTKRGITGETYNAKGELIDSTSSTDSWYIYLGTISASVDADGVTVDRVWTDGLHTGTLATDQYRMEEAQGDWALMFELVNDSIKVLKTITSATINALTVATNFIFGGKTFTGTAGAEDAGKVNKRNDATLPTTGYVQKEIEALDDHFLIKDGDKAQEVGGDVSFFGEVTANTLKVQRNSTINGHISINKKDDDDDVAIISSNYSDTAGQISGFLLTKSGLLTVGGIKAMSFEIFEVIYNKIRSIGGKLSLSSTGNVESCQFVLKDGLGAITPEEFYADNSTYILADIDYVILKIKEDEVNGGLIPFAHNDILYGYVNKVGESGQYARGGQSCMYVLSTNDEIAESNSATDDSKMTIRCKLFAGDVTDENGRLLYDNENRVIGNMPPTNGMTLAHRGNVNSKYPERMTSFFVDSQFGNIVMLQNVTEPVITSSNYATILGVLPTSLFLEVKDLFSQINEYSPVVYAEYGIFRNLIQYNHQGQPIQRENNRGEWSKDEVYRNLTDYYDTVTYEGSLYKCIKDETTANPKESSDWLLLVARGENATFNNIIYNSNFDMLEVDGALQYWYDNDGNPLTSDNVTAEDSGYNSYSKSTAGWVGYTTIPVTIKQGETYTLSCLAKTEGTPTSNTSIYMGFVLDIPKGDLEVIKLNVKRVTSNANNTRTEIYFGECQEWTRRNITFKYIKEGELKNVALRLYVWSAGIEARFQQIKLERGEKVTLYSKSSHDLQGKDGADGEAWEWTNMVHNANFVMDGSTLKDWDASISNAVKVQKNAFQSYNSFGGRIGSDTTFLKQTISLNKGTYTLSFRCLQTNISGNAWVGFKSTGGISITPISTSTKDATSADDYSERYIINSTSNSYDQCEFRITTTALSDVTISFGNIGGYSVYFACPQLEVGEKVTSFSPSLSDLKGPAGEAGASLYPAGEWDAKVEYVKTSTTIPFVVYNNEYFILKADRALGSSYSPENENYWEVFTKYKAFYTEFLMANWAKFGSAKGAIFYDKFLFSQDGIEGHLKEETSYGAYMDNMFDNVGDTNNPDYRLNGNFIPNLFLDFNAGALKVTKLSEPYVSIKGNADGWKCFEIDAHANHNVKIFENISNTSETFSAFEFKNNLVLLPEYDSSWGEDGQHFTILKEFGGLEYAEAMFKADRFNNYDIICCDDGILDMSKTLGSPEYFGNWFIWKGMRSKFVMITPGMMLRLRTQIKDNVCYWYIENASDYSTIDARFFITSNSYARTAKITKPSEGTYTTITFDNNGASPQNNLTNDESWYVPMLLAPSGMFDDVKGTNSRTYFDIAISIGNVKGGNVAPIRTMHSNDFNW